MNTAIAYKLCGTNESKIQRRKETEEKKYGDLRLLNVYKNILANIKKAKGWHKVAFEEWMNDKSLDVKATDRGPIMYWLQANENIISRPVTPGNSMDETIPHTVPLEYKYVDASTKRKMAADAICFRQVQGANKERIVSAISRGQQIRSKWSELFAVSEFLITRGAKKAWIYTRPLEMASMTNVSIDKVMDVLIDLYEAKVLALREFDRPLDGESSRTKSICRIANTDQEFEDFMAIPLSQIDSVGVEKKRRASRSNKLADDAIEAATKAIEQEALAKENIMSTEKTVDIETPSMSQYTSDENIKKAFDAIIEQSMKAFTKDIEKELSTITKGYKDKIAEKNSQITEQSIETADLRDEVKRLQAELEKSKKMQRKLIEFNDGMIAAAQDAMFTFTGEISGIIKKYAEAALRDRTLLADKAKVNNLSGQIIKAAGIISDSMTQYKKDVFPPAEKA